MGQQHTIPISPFLCWDWKYTTSHSPHFLHCRCSCGNYRPKGQPSSIQNRHRRGLVKQLVAVTMANLSWRCPHRNHRPFLIRILSIQDTVRTLCTWLIRDYPLLRRATRRLSRLRIPARFRSSSGGMCRQRRTRCLCCRCCSSILVSGGRPLLLGGGDWSWDVLVVYCIEMCKLRYQSLQNLYEISVLAPESSGTGVPSTDILFCKFKSW